VTTRLAKIRERLATLKAKDTALEVYGASRHRYALGPTLTVANIAHIEASVYGGARLPNPYRYFLQVVGNGGAGPELGLWRFGYVIDRGPHPVPPWGPDHVYPPVTRRDPLRGYYEGMIEVAAAGYSRPRMPFRPAGPVRPVEIFEEHGTTSLDEASEILARADEGTWPLADCGQGMVARLVLHGPFRGEVWIDDRANSCSFMPFTDCVALSKLGPSPDDLPVGFLVGAPPDASFLSWYEHWLDTAMHEAREGTPPPPAEVAVDDPLRQLRRRRAESS
jgi:hypothetical protein